MAIESRDTQGRFQSGSGGRKAGSRNKLNADFFTALQADWAAHGAGVIAICRVEKPIEYFRVIATLMPKELRVDSNVLDSALSLMSDEELAAAIEDLKNRIASQAGPQPRLIELQATPVSVPIEGDNGSTSD